MSKVILKVKRIIANEMIYELPDHLIAQVVFFLFWKFIMGKSCTFFGHRDTPASVKPLLEKTLRHLIEQEHFDLFMLGYKGNFDKYALQVLRELKQDFPFIRIQFVAAYVRELNDEKIPDCFDMFDYPPIIEASPKKFAFSARNRYLAECCDCAVVYVARGWGGAYEATYYFLSKKKHIVNLATDDKVNSSMSHF